MNLAEIVGLFIFIAVVLLLLYEYHTWTNMSPGPSWTPSKFGNQQAKHGGHGGHGSGSHGSGSHGSGGSHGGHGSGGHGGSSGRSGGHAKSHLYDDDIGPLLRRNGWVLYTKTGCIWCTRQLEVLDQLGVDDCPQVVDSGQFSAYPTWYNIKTGEEQSGFKDANALVKLATMMN